MYGNNQQQRIAHNWEWDGRQGCRYRLQVVAWLKWVRCQAESIQNRHMARQHTLLVQLELDLTGPLLLEGVRLNPASIGTWLGSIHRNCQGSEKKMAAQLRSGAIALPALNRSIGQSASS